MTNAFESNTCAAYILPFVLGVCWASSFDTLAQNDAELAHRHTTSLIPTETIPPAFFLALA